MRDLTRSILEGMAAAGQAIQDVCDSPGAAPIHAFIRQGADEISQVLAAFPDGVQPVAEMGTMFEPTPQMITESLKGQSVDLQADKIMEL